ncbi:MAG: MFS transporter, partial [Pseudomonadota bacterium]
MLFRTKGFLPYLIIVFINAFIDLGHKIIVQNTVFKIYDGQQQIILTAIVNALILLPFILLLTPAGYCSDKFPKNKVMTLTSFKVVILTLFITLFYYLGWFWPAFAMTFLLAVQSAFYSPAKYGFIKELVQEKELAKANGVVQAVTTIAILAGIFAFSIIFEALLMEKHYEYTNDLLMLIAPAGWLLVGFAILQFLIARLLPKKKETNLALRFDWHKYRSGDYLKNNMKDVFQIKLIYLCIFGLALFWAISQVMLASFPAYAKDALSIENTIIIQGSMACAGIGIMLGAIIAGQISKDKIETCLLPFAVIGIALCLLILPYLPSAIFQAINFLVWGICGGLLLTPYNALIQYHAPEKELGRILAGNNFIQNITMLLFLIMTVTFAVMGMGSEGLFIILL